MRNVRVPFFPLTIFTIIMLIEQPPFLYRVLYPKALWRVKIPFQKTVYLTFDDGPIPEITPWVLDILDEYEVKATFFCVGDNVRKYTYLYEEILDSGHRVGNHTFHHLQGWLTSSGKIICPCGGRNRVEPIRRSAWSVSFKNFPEEVNHP